MNWKRFYEFSNRIIEFWWYYFLGVCLGKLDYSRDRVVRSMDGGWGRGYREEMK